MTDETNPAEFERPGRYSEKYIHIKGWGIDADLKNDPTYPMKQRTDDEHDGYNWERPTQQPVDIEILKSVERPNITAVFGTSTPPSGLSGMIRRHAYKWSESDLRRWLPLVLADRIGVYEGIVEDFIQGKIPNVIKERGWDSEWKYNRKNFVLKAAAVAAVTATIVGVLISRSGNNHRSLH